MLMLWFFQQPLIWPLLGCTAAHNVFEIHLKMHPVMLLLLPLPLQDV